MPRIAAWHVNVVGAVVNLGLGFWSANTGPVSVESLFTSILLLGVAVVGTAAIVPSTALFALGRLRRVAVALNLLVAVGLVVAFSPIALTFSGFLVVAAGLGWREASRGS